MHDLEYVSMTETFSPDTGSTTGSSTETCFRNTLPLVARNKILSNAMDFSLGTSPVINPSLTCLDESVVVSYETGHHRSLNTITEE